jgi:raffinose/stachyose/melibiose transport system substrate-binding protein
MKRTPLIQTLAVATALAALAACGSDDDGGSADGKTVISWWHNSNNDPGKSYYEQVAKDFEADNPDVDVKIEAMQHEDMLTKLDAAFQSGDTPDIYMERGGGELADHVEAGLTKDLSESAADIIPELGGSVAGWQVEDKTYALPFSVGLVGFWYNKELLAQAGVTEMPTTWDEMDQVVAQLKAAGIQPISVGAGDKWPAAHYWYYFAVRECSQEVISEAVTNLDVSDECFLRAGEDLEQFVSQEPFNNGFLSTSAQEGPTSASGLLATGKVAMELQGHWEPGVMQGLTEDNLGLGDKLGWFDFPAVEGGEGDPATAMGGGDAWAVAEGAPAKALDFVNYLLSDEVQQGFAENDMGLPTNPDAVDSVSDPALAGLLEVRDAAPNVQLYFDTAFGQSIGGAMNDEIALLFAGEASPQDIVDATQEAADAEK